MIEVILKIDGMACGMCEAHMNDTIRKADPNAKKVTSSHKKGETRYITQEAPDEAVLKEAIAETGYTLVSLRQEAYQKKGIFGLGRKR